MCLFHKLTPLSTSRFTTFTQFSHNSFTMFCSRLKKFGCFLFHRLQRIGGSFVQISFTSAAPPSNPKYFTSEYSTGMNKEIYKQPRIQSPVEETIKNTVQRLDFMHNHYSEDMHVVRRKRVLQKVQSLKEKQGSRFILSKAKLTEIPREVGSASSITVLDISGNVLSTLPPELGSLQLKRINMSSNYFSEFPPVISRMTILEDIDISFNSITDLPPEMSEMKLLSKLNASNNSIVSIPSEFGALRSLKFVYLRNNQIESLPISLGNLIRLEELDLYSNPLKSPLNSLHKIGAGAVLRYLRTKDRRWNSSYS